MRTALLLASLLLVPAVLAGAAPAKAPFEIAATQSKTFRFQLDQSADVHFTIHFNAGYVRGLSLDGPGKCDITLTSSGGAGDSTMGNAVCKAFPAGASTFTLRLEVGYAKGYLTASKGRWS